MSNLNERAPIKDIRELEEDYRRILEEYSHFPKLDAIAEVGAVLDGLRFAGRYVSRPRNRDLLADWCRNLGRIIYGLSGDFPAMRISPLEIHEALLAARENHNLNEKVEDMVWIASYLPKEEKRSLIEEAYNIAKIITNEEDRAKALKAISNYLPTDEIFIPHQIPPPPSDFVGREGELNELLAYFDKGFGIIGLRGMGGIGKKTLAFVLAERLKDRFPDGQLLVDMRGTGVEPLKPAEAMAQIIRSYRPNEKIPNSPAELANLYRSVLNDKRALLLLVNAIEGEQVRPLLPPAKCGLIVTSRLKFMLPGMVTKDLDVLKIDEAVEFLRKLASFGSSEDEKSKMDAWRELAYLCGCLPLALRAAGSHFANTPDLSLVSYIENLKDERTRLELIGGEGVDMSIDAIINLSFEKLDPAATMTFLNLSVFPADFDDQAEESICQDKAHRYLSELVRWSLVDFQPQDTDYGRYKLHDLVRLFASSRQPDELKAISQKRHAAYYKNLLSKADELYLQGGSSIQMALAIFDRDEANIVAGQAWAKKNMEEDRAAAELCRDYPTAGAYVIDLRLHTQQKIAWLEAALSAARKLKDKIMEGVHLGNLGLAYFNFGEVRRAIEYYEQALTIARDNKDRMGEGSALGNLGLAYSNLGDARKSIEYYENALDIDRKIGDRRGEGTDTGNLGLAYFDLGDTRKAIEYCEQALAIASEIGDRRNEGLHLGSLGIFYRDLNMTAKAIEYYEQALAIAREIGDKRSEGVHLGNLGSASIDLGDTGKSIEYYRQALAIARENGDRGSEATLLGNLGMAYANQGENYTAIELITQNLVIARKIGDRRGEGAALGSLGYAYAALGDVRKAIDYYDQALAISRNIGDKRNEGAVLGNLGNAYYALSDAKKAIDYYEQALAISREIGDRWGEGVALGNLGLAFAALGDTRKAIDYYEQALSISREIGDKRGEAAGIGNIGWAYSSLGDNSSALGYFEQALAIAREIGDKGTEAASLGNLGSTYYSMDEANKALDYFKKQLETARQIGDRYNEGSSLWGQAICYEKMGELSRAIEIAEGALMILEKIDSPSGPALQKLLSEWKGKKG